NLLSEDESGSIRVRRDNWILTPHPGEAGRLLGCETAEIQRDRFAAVAQLQDKFGGVCLLKGAGSLICFQTSTGRQTELCSEGNAGMASGGMGDVLSGLTGGLVAQGFALHEALQVAVCVHGESADLAADALGQRGLLATDLYPFISQLLNPRQ
ncbi:MAG: NAD(P)H-hydrate dehydratase, partial [Pseudohongiellaceae bacterium]